MNSPEVLTDELRPGANTRIDLWPGIRGVAIPEATALCAISDLSAQEPFPQDEVLKQVYRDYDADKNTAQ